MTLPAKPEANIEFFGLLSFYLRIKTLPEERNRRYCRRFDMAIWHHLTSSHRFHGSGKPISGEGRTMSSHTTGRLSIQPHLQSKR